ncbi:hypothetical protein [uncultured Sulfitobacter sp.]|uniref:hypothetical protein n=1 Tax=uncultured Sulfitobacter sp. TaxID=191468 RepID=UPI00260B45A7|nr:hypothetical protein [uncultured Sulfitobacter sp.]
MSDLHAQMLAAHATGDVDALIGLYTQAADQASDVDQACFFLTHAHVFALEAGDPRAQTLRAQLVSHGRETSE